MKKSKLTITSIAITISAVALLALAASLSAVPAKAVPGTGFQNNLNTNIEGAIKGQTVCSFATCRNDPKIDALPNRTRSSLIQPASANPRKKLPNA